jgi:hypothetical protein
MKSKLIRLLKRKNGEKNVSSNYISSLGPRILKNKEDIEKIQPYLDKLNDTIDANGIYNIALSGGYGSGKSTILYTFKDRYKQHKYLTVSLAAFNKRKDVVSDEKNNENTKEQKEELERLLEISILQQIIYHVKPAEIPASRFKRILNIQSWKILLYSVLVTTFIFSTILLFKNNIFDKINPNNWGFQKSFDWYFTIIFLITLIGSTMLIKVLFKLLSNSKINKLNLKGEIEIGDNLNTSVFNQHLEEILYFFERTKYNVVIIEDLDRFENTDIFTKLREINILLNNSKLINRKIKFIYAIGDTLLIDKKERVKFFEFIIPVIPYINSSNAKEQLLKLIKESDLPNDIFSDEFLNDITTFIDDIDMRLLINIFHEFTIYRKILKTEFVNRNEAQLFAIITYKNLEPDDFCLLHENKGKLFNLFNKKLEYLSRNTSLIYDEIGKLNDKLKIINKEVQTNLRNLKKEYILEIMSNIKDYNLINIDYLLTNTGFNEQIAMGKLPYKKISLTNSYYSPPIDEVHYYNFADIENAINPKLTYIERVDIIKKKDSINEIKKQIAYLTDELNQIKYWDLKEIFFKFDIDAEFNNFSNIKLMRNLISEGYINENYLDYITLFHEEFITKDDKKFANSVKSAIKEDFDFKLNNISNLIKYHIGIKYFSRKEILNYDLIDFLENNYKEFSERYDDIINLLTKDQYLCIEFIDGYLRADKSKINILIEKLSFKWESFWKFVLYEANLSDSKINDFLILIIKYSSLEFLFNDININLLPDYINKVSNILNLLEPTQVNYLRIKDIINKLFIKFEKLDNPPDNEFISLFHYIYENNHYKINPHNILLFIKHYTKDKEIVTSFYSQNYTIIKSSNCIPLFNYIKLEINDYIENVYLAIEENTNDIEETIVELLNNPSLDFELKVKIINKVESNISNLSLIIDMKIKELLLTSDILDTGWENVIDYFINSGNLINKNLVEYLNKHKVYKKLANETIIEDLDKFKKIDFIYMILLNNDLSDDCYINILKSNIEKIENIPFEKLFVQLGFRKKLYLYRNFLKITPTIFNCFYIKYPTLITRLIIYSFNDFLNTIKDYKLNKDIVILLLESQHLDNVQKKGLFERLDTELQEDEEIKMLVGL